MELKVGYVCDRGLNPRRPVNQDRFLSVPERGLFAVFDGVGGQRAGEVASQTAVETIEEALAHVSAGSSLELISRAIRFANRDIFELAESDEAYRTMATTIALLHVDGDRAIIAHVGDSRVYRLEDGRFYRETVDHTDFNDAVRGGLIGIDGSLSHPKSNVINRALGVDRDVEVEGKQIKLHDGARFLLCSDGIYRHLSDEEIARVLAENKDPQRAADELKRLVHERGAEDNLTAVVVQAGRARVGPVLAIDDHRRVGKKESSETREAKLGAPNARSDQRIRVEFGTPRLSSDGEPSRLDAQVESSEHPSKRDGVSPSRVLMYVLIPLVLITGGFYAGLRASEWRAARASEQGAVANQARELKVGKEAFERGAYREAANEFELLVKQDPQDATALYWLGRTCLEQRDYAGAARNLEAAIAREPRIFDAYVYAAAAYEFLGEKTKAADMLARHAEERRRAERALTDNQR
ncbi:MAG TPA: protein phosphatase 2C domain-containing protein [Blastocatellia bacterium]|nr:protein phosphatase 2C domain-containing protein [Blastocatellia bacterium]